MGDWYRPLVIYHASCADGFGAAYVAHAYFASDATELVPAHYGDAPPDVAGRDVLIVDFSYPRDVLIEMHGAARSLRVFDHHKTAQAALEGLDFCTFDMNRSGAGLAWDELMAPNGRQRLIDYVEDRDLWRWKLPKSREVNAAIAVWERTISKWDALWYALERNFDALVAFGEGALAQVDAYVKAQKDRAHIVADRLPWRDGAVRFPIINTTFATSELVGELAEGHPYAVGWFERADGSYVYSLRSRDGGADVSEVAQRYGGGGHARAAGFTSERAWWELWVRAD